MSDDDFGDAVYEVWRRGGNPDLVDRDGVRDYVDRNYGDVYGFAEEFLRKRGRTEQGGEDE